MLIQTASQKNQLNHGRTKNAKVTALPAQRKKDIKGLIKLSI
jgi:hypothetical protein